MKYMEEVKGYKCPNCNGDIVYDANIQKMSCPYCGSELEIESLKELAAIDNTIEDSFGWDEVKLNETLNEETSGLKCYVCESCGGEIVGDETMASSSCPYCGNHVIVSKQFEGILKPDYVIPFKYDKKAAVDKLHQHFKGKILLPNDFADKKIMDKIVGVYVPYWLFDCDAKGAIRYRATKIRTYRSGDYQVTETFHFLLNREGDMSFTRVPVDASKKFDKTLLEAIEPYDVKNAVDFKTAYMQGFLSDRFSLMPDEVIERANQRIKHSLSDELIKTTVGYSSVVPENSYVNFEHGKISYALLPVWILNVKYKGELYTFAMNGQTGKFVGDLPSDNMKFMLYMLLVFVVVFVLVSAMMFFVA